MNESLNFPETILDLKRLDGKEMVFDLIRKKYVVAGPEELVRQHLIHFLIDHRSFPKGLLSVEREFHINGRKKRFDLLVFDSAGKALLVAECKAPSVPIDQKTFEQISVYNIPLQVPYWFLTNGHIHYSCAFDVEKKTIKLLDDLPFYDSL